MKILNKFFSLLLVLGTVQVQATPKNMTAKVQVQATHKNMTAKEMQKLLKASILIKKDNIEDLSKIYTLSRIVGREEDPKIINDCNDFISIIKDRIKTKTKALKILESGNLIGKNLMDKIELSEMIKKQFNKELDNFIKSYIEKIKSEKNKKKNKARNNKFRL